MSRWLKSSLCTYDQHNSAEFRRWCERMGQAHFMHRKLWEFAYIAQALFERGMLAPGRRGLGFGVGQEPLTALFASYGCEIVATDLEADQAREAGWVETNQHAASLEALNERGLCDPDLFRQRVTFRNVDMNSIPADLRDFDFTWSACSFEHLGSIDLGLRFIEEMLACLKPGGYGVHTTEFNLSSDEETLDRGDVVLFRRRDFEGLARRLTASGHAIDLDLTPGVSPIDQFVDIPPYKHNPHLRLRWQDHVTTSVGLIVQRDGARRRRSGPHLFRSAAGRIGRRLVDWAAR